MDDLTQFDVLLDDGNESRGYLVSWESTESEPFALVIEEQTVPESVSSNQEDENYGFRDLTDTWRVSYTNFSGGEGQRLRDVAKGTHTKYWKSDGIDNSTAGVLHLHHRRKLLQYGSVTQLIGPTSVSIAHQNKFLWSRENRTPSQFMALGQYSPVDGSFEHVCPLNPPEHGRVTALASTGNDLYLTVSGGTATWQGLWKYSGDLRNGGTLISSPTDTTGCKLIDRMCVSGGQLYASANSQVGYIKDAGGGVYAFDMLSPYLLNYGRTCFGMVGGGTWVYWGVHNGASSFVYRVQWNPAEPVGDGQNFGVKHFEQCAELPAGFVGTTLVESLGNIFVCGYYRGRHGNTGQGVVYLLTENGAAILCRIGDSPDENPVLADWSNNKIVAGCASEHWLYLLTERDLYRWNVRDGGLNRLVTDLGSFVVSGGSSGTVATTPWDLAGGYWPEAGYGHRVFLPNDMPPLSPIEREEQYASVMTSEWDDIQRAPLYAEPDTSSAVVGVRVSSNTGDKAGNSRWHRSRLKDASFANGGCLEFKASNFWRQALELEVTSNTYSACIALRGSVDSDIVRVYYYDQTGNRSVAPSFGTSQETIHDIFLSCDQVTGMANLWVDNMTRPLFTWRMPDSGYEPGIAYTFGACRLGDTDYKDWRVVPSYMRWAGGTGYVPGWSSASGTVGAFSFAVIDGMPFIPSDVSNALFTLDWDAYEPHGELWTSVSSAQMPTVDKYVTALDVHYDQPASGDSIVVTPIVNGIEQRPSLTIDDSTDPDTGRRIYDGNVASLPMVGVRGTEVQAKVTLNTTSGKSTPYFRGTSLRFNPIDNSYYLLRLDLRDARKDNTGRMTDTAADIAFLKEAAESKRVLLMTTPLESHRVRISTLQFLASAPLRGAEVNPQGIALLKLKRVV